MKKGQPNIQRTFDRVAKFDDRSRLFGTVLAAETKGGLC